MRVQLTFVLASLLSLASFAHAELILNAQEIQQKSVSTCLSLYRALDNVSALAASQKIVAQPDATVDYGALGDRLLTDFNALNCQSFLAQEHARVAQKEANCKKLRANLDRAEAQMDEAALDGLNLGGARLAIPAVQMAGALANQDVDTRAAEAKLNRAQRAQDNRISRANANFERALNAMESSGCSRR